MMEMSPPPIIPPIAIEERPSGRMRVRLKLIAWATITVFLTAWICTMGPIPAVLGLVVAKHILVAILLMGVGVDRRSAEVG